MVKKYKHVMVISFLVIVIIISSIIIKEINPEKKDGKKIDITDVTKSKSYEKPDDDEIDGYWLNENNELLNISIKNQEYFIHSFTPSLVYYYEKDKVLKDVKGNENQRQDYSIIEKGDNYEIWKCTDSRAPLRFCKLIENGGYYEIQTSRDLSKSWTEYGFKSLYIVKSKKLLFYSKTTSNNPDTGKWNNEEGLLGTYYYFKDKKAFISQENKYSTRPPFNESVAFYKIKEVPQQ